MKHSYFCRDCEILHSKGFFFDTCNILVRLLKVSYFRGRDCYVLEVLRYRNDIFSQPTNERVVDDCYCFRDALDSYLFTIDRYKCFYNRRFRNFM